MNLDATELCVLLGCVFVKSLEVKKEWEYILKNLIKITNIPLISTEFGCIGGFASHRAKMFSFASSFQQLVPLWIEKKQDIRISKYCKIQRIGKRARWGYHGMVILSILKKA